jgi:predicted transcriptional regulator
VDIKAAAHQVIDSLPAGANWEDLQYAIYVRQCIDAGLADVAAGRVRDVNDVRRQFGLPPCT